MGNLVKNGISYTGGSGASSYNELNDKPRINGTTLSGNKTLGDLGIATEINELDDVDISTPSNNDVLKYNSTSGKWENGEGGSGGGGHTIEDAEGTDLTQRDTLQFGEGLLAEDDSTNEKTVVALDPMPSEDIDEVVDIYPTAGELVSIVNAFNRGDIYSTDEKMIGQWKDGKPLYQIVVHLSTQGKFYLNGSWQTLCSSPSNDLDTLVSVRLHAVGTSNTYKNTVSYVNSFTYDETAQTIKGWDDSNTSQNYILFDDIILQYTKTTDVAISIGSTTEYSTDEKVVGTWIDGKPLYQKTVEIASFPNATSGTYPHGIANVDKIIDYSGQMYFPSNYMSMKLGNGYPISSTSDISNASYGIFVQVDRTNIGITVKQNRTSCSGWITIQYTKSTT